MKSQLREFVKQVVKEEQDYQQLFKTMLDMSGKSIATMSDDDKIKFFNAVDKAYQAKTEGKLNGYNQSVNEASYTVKADNEYQFINGAAGILFRYSQDKKLDSGTRNTLQKVVKDLEGLKKYFFSRKDESIKEAELTAGQKKIDVDGDGEIEGSDLAKLRKDEIKKKK